MLILTGSIWELIRGPFDGFLTKILSWLFLWIDSLIYYGVNLAYRTYISLASVRLFGDNTSVYLTDLTERVYIVIGVIALFLVAYALLVAIINPDNANKGDKSLGKLIPNIAIAIVGMAIVPTVFDWAYKAQDLILYNNIIQKLILENNDDSVNVYTNAGSKMATTLFQSFFHATEGNEPSSIISSSGVTLASAYEQAENGSPFTLFLGFTDSVADGKIEYLYLFSTIAGGFCCYVLISFCIDMGIRLFKLAYLQLISPLPILMNIIPGQKKVFQNWLKKTVSCFMEVFVRIFCISFVVFIVTHLVDFFGNLWPNGNQPTGIVVLLVHAFIIVGLFAFLKQAPKIVSEVMGIDSKGLKLGIKDKLAESGVFQAVGAVGGAVGSMANGAVKIGSGAVRGIQNFRADKAANGWSPALKNAGMGMVIGTVKGIAGTPRAFTNTFNSAAASYKNAKDAKSFGDVGRAVQEGVAEGKSKPGVMSSVAENVRAFGSGAKNTLTADYTPYNSKAALAKAKQYDEVKKAMDDINAWADSKDSVKAVDEAYNAKVKKLEKDYQDGKIDDVTLRNELTSARSDLNKAKNEARAAVIGANASKDLKLKGLLETQAAAVRKNRDVLIELYSKGGLLYAEDAAGNNKNQGLIDELKSIEQLCNNIKDGDVNTYANGSTLRSVSTASGKVSSYIHTQAFEQEQKQKGNK